MSKKILLTVEDIITSSQSYPERAKSEELTEEVLNNINKLVNILNEVLNDLGVESVKVSSGFRPSSVNSKIANAAKRSNHQTGKAVDLIDDKNQSLCKLFTQEVLEKYNLYREDSDYTKGKWTSWVHLQFEPTKSGRRIFRP